MESPSSIRRKVGLPVLRSRSGIDNSNVRWRNRTIRPQTLATLTGKAISIRVLRPRSIIHSNRELIEKHVPTRQHTVAVAKHLKPHEGPVIGAQRELRPPWVRTKMSTHHNSSQHLATCSTVPTLRLQETPDWRKRSPPPGLPGSD